jgi:phage regulator Rha-like protein
MSEVLILDGFVPTMTSREIADITEKEHGHVIRDIRSMLDGLRDDPDLDHVREIKDARGYTSMVELPRNLTITLVAGYRVDLRKRIVDRWQALEAQAAKPRPPAELTRMDILRLAMESEEARIKAEAERDRAVATKHLIGSKREATAMASASVAKREVARLRDQLGFSQRHATILQVEDATGCDFDFLPLRRWCKANGVEAASVPDKRYPNGVKAWPAGAWRDCYGVELGRLFA